MTTQDDWGRLRDDRGEPRTLVDPTVVRIADLFIRGRSGQTSSWTVIEENLSEVAAFVDALVLEPGLAIPDLGKSVDDMAGWEVNLPPLFDVCEPLLAPVVVESAVWWPHFETLCQQMKQAAPLPEESTRALGKRLTSMGWTFGETLRLPEPNWPLSNNMLVNGFLYVISLFGRYASELGERGTQLVSAKATSALIAAALAEDKLSVADAFATFRQFCDSVPGAQKRTLHLEQPSFLPYLLNVDGVERPADLFAAAMTERNQPDVRDYREWLGGIRARADAGDISPEALQDINDAVNQLAKRYAPHGQLKFNINMQVFPPGPTVGYDVDASPLRDWARRTVPGKRYRRVLLNLTQASVEKVQVNVPLRRLWNAA